MKPTAKVMTYGPVSMPKIFIMMSAMREEMLNTYIVIFVIDTLVRLVYALTRLVVDQLTENPRIRSLSIITSSTIPVLITSVVTPIGVIKAVISV